MLTDDWIWCPRCHLSRPHDPQPDGTLRCGMCGQTYVPRTPYSADDLAAWPERPVDAAPEAK